MVRTLPQGRLSHAGRELGSDRWRPSRVHNAAVADIGLGASDRGVFSFGAYRASRHMAHVRDGPNRLFRGNGVRAGLRPVSTFSNRVSGEPVAIGQRDALEREFSCAKKNPALGGVHEVAAVVGQGWPRCPITGEAAKGSTAPGPRGLAGESGGAVEAVTLRSMGYRPAIPVGFLGVGALGD